MEHFQANKAQEQAIASTAKHLILIACPGSGKTTTLLRRIHHLIQDEGAEEQKILMITFTKAAATHMKEQYYQSYGMTKATFCTIHSLCYATLRKFRGLQSSMVLSEKDMRQFVYDQLRGNKDIDDREEFTTAFLCDMSVVSGNRLDPSEYAQTCCDDKDLFLDLLDAYHDFKNNNRKIDFDDMLTDTLRLLEEDPKALSFLQELYQYILVDEYQDVNYAQRDIIDLLAKNASLAVVGDDDQSVYGFRGAHPDIMLDFPKVYPDAEVVTMSTNYRSSRAVIENAAALIHSNKQRFPKDFTGSRKETGSCVIISAPDRKEEIAILMERIQDRLGKGVSPDSIAVLYRNNMESEAVAGALMDGGVPFVSSDQIPCRYDHWIYKDILAYHELAQALRTTKGKITGEVPGTLAADDISEAIIRKDLARILNHPNRYLERRVADCGLHQQTMTKMACKGKADWQRRNASAAISDLFEDLAAMKDRSPKETMELMSSPMNYDTCLQQYADFRHVDEEGLRAIWQALLLDASRVSSFEEWAELGDSCRERMKNSTGMRHGIHLSTIHKAKGLEWKCVFIIDVQDGVIPSAQVDSEAGIEEERRLFYVAMTRARDDVTILWAKQFGSRELAPSPFLQEMEENRIILQQEARQNQAAGLKDRIAASQDFTGEEKAILEAALHNYSCMQKEGWHYDDLKNVAEPDRNRTKKGHRPQARIKRIS